MAATPYSEGDWCGVPLRDDAGFAVGRIARCAAPFVLGYFFGPASRSVPSITSLTDLLPQDACVIALAGDLNLLNGAWPLIGGGPAWDPAAWPLPEFGFADSLLHDRFTARSYDATLNLFVAERRISKDEYLALPRDGLLGAGAAEIVVTKVLAGA